MDYQICTQSEGALECWSAVGVVDHYFDIVAIAFDQSADRGYVDNSHIGVNRGFEIDHFGFVAEVTLQFGMICEVGIADIHAKLL